MTEHTTTHRARAEHAPPARPVISADDLRQIMDELDRDGVWVDPGYASTHHLDTVDETRLEEAVEGLARPVRVLLVEPSYDDPEYQGRAEMLVTAIHLEDGTDSLYLTPQVGGPRLMNVLDQRQDDFQISRLAEHRHPGDLADQLVEQIALSGQSEAAVTQQYAAEIGSREPSAPSHQEEGLSALQVSGLIVAALALVMVAVAGWRAFVRRRTEFRPSGTLLRRAKGAEQRSRRQVAEADAVNLAIQIGQAPTAAPSTRTALAHLEAAQRALATRHPGARGEADVVGALVLLERGAASLVGATQPARTCWFNPLHRAAATTVTWQHEQRSVQVPACTACARQVSRGREPSDILDLADSRGTRHWFQLELGPWTATGFGAFSTDLPADLLSDGAHDD